MSAFQLHLHLRFCTLPLLAVAAIGCSDSDPTDPIDETCALRTTLTTGTPVSGELTASDCSAGTTFLDHYTWTATANEAVNVTLASTVFNTLLAVSHPTTSQPIAQNDDVALGNTNSRVKLIAAAGPKTVTAAATSAATGAYTLSVTGTAESAENCELVFAELGVTTTQMLSPTDCVLNATFNDDQFRVFVSANQRIRVTMRSSTVDSYLELYAPSGAFVVFDDDSGGGAGGVDAQLLHTAMTSGYYILSASSAFPGETGDYVLTVETAPASAGNAQLIPSPRASKPGGRLSQQAR